jgi:hypothetical protein
VKCYTPNPRDFKDLMYIFCSHHNNSWFFHLNTFHFSELKKILMLLCCLSEMMIMIKKGEGSWKADKAENAEEIVRRKYTWEKQKVSIALWNIIFNKRQSQWMWGPQFREIHVQYLFSNNLIEIFLYIFLMFYH